MICSPEGRVKYLESGRGLAVVPALEQTPPTGELGHSEGLLWSSSFYSELSVDEYIESIDSSKVPLDEVKFSE